MPDALVPPPTAPRARSIAPTSMPAIAPAALSTRHRAEAEHEERLARRERLRAQEDRMAAYRSRIFTPSGRPYDSLPIVSLGELRQQLKGNQRSLAAAMHEASDYR